MAFLAGLEVNALSKYNPVFLAGTLGAHAQVIGLKTVLGHTHAISINAPVIEPAFGALTTVASIIEVIPIFALVAVAC